MREGRGQSRGLHTYVCMCAAGACGAASRPCSAPPTIAPSPAGYGGFRRPRRRAYIHYALLNTRGAVLTLAPLVRAHDTMFARGIN